MAARRPDAGAVRPADARDRPAVLEITEAVFSVFGEYGSWLPGYLDHPGVWSFAHERDGRVCGFAMLGLLDPDPSARTRAAELLAIAVDPRHQGAGVGRALLRVVVEKGRELADSAGVEELCLTVAEPNRAARTLFARFGFDELPGDHGLYERGQRALRLRLPLAGPVRGVE